MKKYVLFLSFIFIAFCCVDGFGSDSSLENQIFIDIEKLIPGIVTDIRYFGPHNFVGERIDGYNAAKCLVTQSAGRALSNVQADLKAFALSLKIYDCYRPQRAVNHFVRWAKDIADTRTKKEFYPTVDKTRLFEDGYIAEKSGHSRGSTVDVTLVPLPVPAEKRYVPGEELFPCFLEATRRFGDNSIDMGTGFDCFHDHAHTASNDIEPHQRANRFLLKELMEKHGFVNYDKEWWHFTLRDEPYPATYFDFVIE